MEKDYNEDIASRNILGLFKKDDDRFLTDDEIKYLSEEIAVIGANISRFRFNEGEGVGFVDRSGIIRINKCILTGQDNVPEKYRLSPRGILAHEYWGHLMNHPSPFEPNTPEDECWADDSAARRSPGLTDEERTILLRRALRYAQIARAQSNISNHRFAYNIDEFIRRYISDDEIREFNR